MMAASTLSPANFVGRRLYGMITREADLVKSASSDAALAKTIWMFCLDHLDSSPRPLGSVAIKAFKKLFASTPSISVGTWEIEA